MKEGIHPKYGTASVRCACGETFETGSVKKEIKVEFVPSVHPYLYRKAETCGYGGRVDRFKKRFNLDKEEKEEE